MSGREVLFAAVVAAGLAGVVVGVSMVAAWAGWVVAGLALVAWGWLVLGDVA